MKPFANEKGSTHEDPQEAVLTGSEVATVLPMSVLEQLIQQSPVQNRMAMANTLTQVLKTHGVTEISPRLYELITAYTTPVGTDFEWIYPRRRNAFTSFKRVKAAKSTQDDIPGYYLG